MRRIALSSIVIALLGLQCAMGMAADRHVLAFYYTWYGTPDHGGEWRHWNEGGHNPAIRNASGQLDISAVDHPPALYDSADPAVIERHLAEAKAAGLNGLVATWWGQGDYHDVALRKCLDAAVKAKSPVKFSAYYETVNPASVEQAVKDLTYLVTEYGDSDAFLKSDGVPVLFVYGKALSDLGLEKWQEVLKTFRASHKAKLIADSTSLDWAALFDGLHTYNVAPSATNPEELDGIYRNLVETAHRRKGIACLDVVPGYEGVTLLPRLDGKVYGTLWTKAIAAQPDWIIVTSFNQWHEGTEIEPSVEYGQKYLEMTAAMAKQFREAQFTAEATVESCTYAEVALDKVNASTRLYQVEWADGGTDPGLVLERPCRRTKGATAKPRFIYFDVDDCLDLSRGVRVFVDYFDMGKGVMQIQYDSSSESSPQEGVYKTSAKCPLVGDGYWKERLFVLPTPRFGGRQNGMSDFRLAILSGDAPISAVRVEAIPVPKPPEPSPTGVPNPYTTANGPH